MQRRMSVMPLPSPEAAPSPVAMRSARCRSVSLRAVRIAMGAAYLRRAERMARRVAYRLRRYVSFARA